MSRALPLAAYAWRAFATFLRAFASFLRGFVGMPAGGLAVNAGNSVPGSCPSPGAARDALTARAAHRPSCC